MGVSVSDRELKKFLGEFDSDGNMLLDPEEFKAMMKAVLRDCKVVIGKDGDAPRRLDKRPARICVEEGMADDGTTRSCDTQSKKSATPGWQKLRVVRYSHLSTPPHILERRVHVASKKAAMRKTRSVRNDGDDFCRTQGLPTPSSRTVLPSAGIAKNGCHLRMPRGVHLKPMAGARSQDSPAQQKLRTPSSRTPSGKNWLLSTRGSRRHV